MPAKASLPPQLHCSWIFVGERLREARLRRGKSAEQVAREAGITRVTLGRLEQGHPSVTVGTLLKVLDALGLADDIGHVAIDEGRRLPREQLRRRRMPKTVRLGDYPQLMSIAWHLASEDTELLPEEAFALYERNWRHLEAARLQPKEQALIDGLTSVFGKGVMLV